ncbi:MAG: carbohydrate ABC transporter permease [Anaerolineae bacterium]
MSRRHRFAHRIGQVLAQIAAVGIVVLFLVPILWMIVSSFKLPSDILTMPPKWLFTPTLDNYLAVLFGKRVIAGTTFPEVRGFPRYLLNSVLISLGATLCSLMIGTPAAYTLARFRFRGKRDLAFYILSTRMAPPLAVLIPFYILFSNFRILDTYTALLIVYTVFNLSFVIWMMQGFFSEIPTELEDAARVDGCSRYGAFARVTLPLTAPGLAATAIFCLLLSWNEFLFALVLTSKVAKTAPVALYNFVTFHEVLWGSLFAAGTMVTFPVLVFTLLAQRNLVRGLTMGAIR